MTTWFTRAATGACAVAVLGLASCKKDEVQATLAPATTPTLTASTSTAVLNQATASNTAVTFNWTPITSFNWTNAEHPYNPAVTYTLQFAKQGTNFAAPVNISAGAGPNTSVTVVNLNTALQSLGFASGTAATVDVRLQSIFANNSPYYTATVPLTATPYQFCAQPASAWGVVGPAGPGWPGGNIDFVMQYDCTAKTYTYTGPLSANPFKFRFGYHWATNLGGSGPTVPLSANGNNLTISANGNYTLTLYNAADTTNLSSAYYTIK